MSLLHRWDNVKISMKFTVGATLCRDYASLLPGMPFIAADLLPLVGCKICFFVLRANFNVGVLQHGIRTALHPFDGFIQR